MNNDFVQEACEQLKERATFINDMWESGKYYFIAPTSYDKKTIRTKWNKDTPSYLIELKERLSSLADFSSECVETEFKTFFAENKLAIENLLPAFRVSITGVGSGPSLFDIVSLLGKNETISRMETALNTIK